MIHDRRDFLHRAVAAPVLAAVPWRSLAGGELARPPFPYVDGLSFLSPNVGDIAASGLTAFILDVSSVAPIKTEDGSIKYWRAFEPCAASITAMRRSLAEGKVGQAFLATRGRQIADAFRGNQTAIFFQFQGGGEAVGRDFWKLDLFHELGLRVFQITHHNNNEWGGGAIEKTWTGLTKIGEEGVQRLNALRIIPDLSRVAEPTSLDVLRVSKRPVIVSHSGAQAIVPNARCTADSVIRGVAQSGGAMGVFMMSFWLTPDPVPSVDAFVRQVRHVVDVGGIDAVAIANDYTIAGELNAVKLGNDNAKAVAGYHAWWDSVAKQGVWGFDTRPSHVVIPELNHVRRMFLIHDALAKAGFTPREVEKIMGGNWIRVLTESLG